MDKETNNKGIGAGGANTNLNGKRFEKKTDNHQTLLDNGYTRCFLDKKKGEYLKKSMSDKTIVFVCQNSFKKCMKNFFDKDTIRTQDEAYIIQYNTGKTVIIIVEKKVQNVRGLLTVKK